ncbi:hypothetical protein [Mesorhizobium marinum]|uniref:hypothetical protein n=1 Tax=Mesorhizobium marinum TaxID=3228790 RepID=UPI00346508E9
MRSVSSPAAEAQLPRRPHVGIYLYGWYDEEKWTSHRFPLRPQIGFYRSGDPLLARWQVEQIARTGVDFVVFEMVPHSDHSFEQICSHVRNCLPLLAERGIGYSFLVDMAIFREIAEPFRIYSETLERLAGEGWLEGCFDCAELGKPLFHFAPKVGQVAELRELAPSQMDWWACTWSPEWGHIRPETYPDGVRHVLGADWEDALARGVTLRESLEGNGYFPFWTSNGEMPVMNGVAAVAAGYDDLMLERDPQLSPPLDHDDGRTLETQFRNAQANDAHTVIVYGWNEYFETAVIEPTLDWGDFYLRLTSHFVSQLKSGEPIGRPDWATRPEPAKPLYLTPDLAKAGASHPDGLPRWDRDEWKAEFGGAVSIRRAGDRLSLDGICVMNTGIRSWSIASEKDPIRLGVRLFDGFGAVQREGRAALAAQDVQPGSKLDCSIEVDVSGLPAARYRAEIGVVWENRMWFHPKGGLPLVCDVEIS